MKPAKKLRERDIERYLVAAVKALGGEVRKVKWVGRRGAPDRLVMLPCDINAGRHQQTIWVELKAPGVKAEAYQLREHVRMMDMGQNVVVVDSIERVNRVLS